MRPSCPLHWRWRIAAAAVFCVAAVVLGTMFFENRLIFFPTRFPEGDWTAASRSRIPTREVSFPAADGVRLNAWYLEAPVAGPRHTILYFHGNAGNLTDRYDWACQLAGLPANVLLVDYRGYGKSEGTPGEPGVYADAEGAWTYLTGERGIDGSRIVIVGKSLGGAVACELATHHECAALILQSTFTSIRDMARVAYPWLPRAFIRTRFETVEKIGRVRDPVLIVHSRSDELVPFWMAERLYAAASEPKRLLAFHGSAHNEMVGDHGPEVVAAIREFLGETR